VSPPRILLIAVIAIVLIFIVLLAVEDKDSGAPSGHAFVERIKDAFTNARTLDAGHVPADTKCFGNAAFVVQSPNACTLNIPKGIRHVRLHIAQGQPTATLFQNRGRWPGTKYNLAPAKVEGKNGELSMDLKGDGGTAFLTCPVATCRLTIDT
jgi:hypothetical protein